MSIKNIKTTCNYKAISNCFSNGFSIFKIVRFSKLPYFPFLYACKKPVSKYLCGFISTPSNRLLASTAVQRIFPSRIKYSSVTTCASGITLWVSNGHAVNHRSEHQLVWNTFQSVNCSANRFISLPLILPLLN